MLQIYSDTLERLLISLIEEDELQQQRHQRQPPALINDDASVWPPWPWPPWGGDDEGKPINRTLEAHDLAEGVVAFERKLARASLDLYVPVSYV